jgi:hypothetical protein
VRAAIPIVSTMPERARRLFMPMVVPLTLAGCTLVYLSTGFLGFVQFGPPAAHGRRHMAKSHSKCRAASGEKLLCNSTTHSCHASEQHATRTRHTDSIGGVDVVDWHAARARRLRRRRHGRRRLEQLRPRSRRGRRRRSRWRQPVPPLSSVHIGSSRAPRVVVCAICHARRGVLRML